MNHSHETFSSNIPIRVCSINELSEKDGKSRIHIYKSFEEGVCEFDVDGDGQLSFEEYRQWLK